MHPSTIYAQSQGLNVALFGNAAATHDIYHSIQRSGELKRARIDALLRGQAVSGMRLDGAPADRRDRIARDSADTLAWAEFYEDRFGSGAGKALIEMARQGARKDELAPQTVEGLTYYMPEVVEVQYADLPCWDGKFFAIDKTSMPAANEIKWLDLSPLGSAKVASSYDLSGIPMVPGPAISDNVMRVVPGLVGYTTNFMDPRREVMTKQTSGFTFDIERHKRQACERALAQFVHGLWYAGDAQLGINGVFNEPAIQTLTLTGLPWPLKTATQVLEDLKTIAFSIGNRTLGRLGDTGKLRIMLPPDAYQALMRPITVGADTTVLGFFNSFWAETNAGKAPKVEMEYTLASANSQIDNGGGPVLAQDTALVIYSDGDKSRDPMFVLPQSIEIPTPVRMTGIGDVTIFHVRASGLRMPDAERVLKVVGL